MKAKKKPTSSKKTTPAKTKSASRGAAKAKTAEVSIDRILVPVDFSDRSRKTLRYAIGLARKHGASLTLIHVVEPVIYPAEMGFAAVSLQTVDANLQNTARERLQHWSDEEVPSDIQAATKVVVGSAYIEITDQARKEKADMIILSTHGYTGLKHVLLGSTAERVVRHATCPVLTLHQG